MEDDAQGAALQRDLHEMEALVREGVSYAKTLHAAAEVPRRIDPDALLDSMACDYRDAGQAVTRLGSIGGPLVTRPQALRRILTNLVDNALKFTGAGRCNVGRQALILTIVPFFSPLSCICCLTSSAIFASTPWRSSSGMAASSSSVKPSFFNRSALRRCAGVILT
jgi:hypothetical protein